MKKAKYIDPKDLQKLQYDKNGNIIIPDGFEIYIKEDVEEKRKIEIKQLEEELARMKEPSDKELIEEGKLMHPYYVIKNDIEYLKNELGE